MRTLIHARYVIAYRDGRHVLLDDGDVVAEGDTIVYVGPRYAGPVDRRIDAPDRLLTPGLISVHAHLSSSSLTKSFLEDRGNPIHYMSGLYDALAILDPSPDDGLLAARCALAELIRSGVTTVVELGRLMPEQIAALAGQLGVRAYVVPVYRSGRWLSPDGRRVVYEWREDQGLPDFMASVDFLRKHDGAWDGRIKSFLGPAQIDTCSPELLRRTAALAEELNVPVTIHAAQSVIEFQEITRRHGMTPIEWLHHVGLLNRRLIIGHCIYLSGHPQVVFPNGRDLELLAASGASVAHCPWVFGRRGVTMRSYARYLRAGVNVALGTDTFPHDMLREMRWAAVLGKVAEEDPRVATAADVFTSATLGGARALHREDLGRIAPGAKADLLLFRLDTLTMSPVRDPLRNLVFTGSRHDLDTVIVGGRTLMSEGRLEGIDERALARDLQAAAERLWRSVPDRDPARRTADQMSTPSLPRWDDLGHSERPGAG